MLSINEVAQKLGLQEDNLELYGKYKAKIPMSAYHPDKALKDLKKISDLGLQGLPICIAKTQKSLSDDPSLLGRPSGFSFKIREIEIAAGAGFLVPIAGDMMRMHGLSALPAAQSIDIDDEGNISGLF